MTFLGLKFDSSLYSVVVCYHPDILKLADLCENLLKVGSKVFLIDNTEGLCAYPHDILNDCQLIRLGYNTGIAHAQNVGVKRAIADGAEVVAFFDQDSTISASSFFSLVSALKLDKSDVVAPLYVDDVSGIAIPSTWVNRFGLSGPIHCVNTSAPYPVDVVISSGTVATKRVFQTVGLFDEDFFIDFVDTEWCLRCRANQISIRVIPAAIMYNRIGSESFRTIIMIVYVHSPVRCYYQIRNCFHLFRKKNIPFIFALKKTALILVSRTLLLLFVSAKLKYVRVYLCAVRDGIIGVTGSKPL